MLYILFLHDTLSGDSQMIHLIATVTIQRLNQQKSSGFEAKGSTVMSPVMEEEEEQKVRQSIPHS